MFYRAVIRTETPAPAEYVTVPMHTGRRDRDVAPAVAVAAWTVRSRRI